MNQIETYSELKDLNSIQVLGGAIALSGMFGCNKDEQGVILALQCMAENKPPLEMAKNYHIINGKLSKRADAMLADFRKAGGKFVFDDLKNPKEQKATVTFEDYKGLKVSYSIDDATEAKLLPAKPDSAWNKTPSAMLRARLISETLRAIAPEIVVGTYTPEEISDFDKQPVKASTVKSATKPKESKPKAKKPEPKKAEVIEAEIVDEPIKDDSDADSYLAGLIGKDEATVNDYWINKVKIDAGQTWRDLPESLKIAMQGDFVSFIAAARKATK